jgi:hypothetical protein
MKHRNKEVAIISYQYPKSSLEIGSKAKRISSKVLKILMLLREGKNTVHIIRTI